MNRLFRRIRRRRGNNVTHAKTSAVAQKHSASLALEPLEQRTLLTTLTLPAGTSGELVFQYADAGENSPGDEADLLNEIRIGTLSDLGPSKDVVVELLSYQGQNIPGRITIPGVGSEDLYGGPGGVAVLNDVGWIRSGTDALATNSLGVTYGISGSGMLFRMYQQSDGSWYSPYSTRTVEDTDAVDAAGSLVQYSDFQAAAFSPLDATTMYAVVESPTRFDANGNANDWGQVLIKIDVTTGEADPVATDAIGLPSYAMSEIGDAGTTTEITTLVYSQIGGDNAGDTGSTPTFIAFDAGDNDRFLRISVDDGFGGSVNVGVNTIIAAPEDTRIEGLMYGTNKQGEVHLYGLDNSGKQLVTVNLFPEEGEEAVYTDIAAFPEVNDNAISLTGMTWDPLSGFGYASDPDYGDYYQINTKALITDGEGNLAVEGGLADVYTVYITSSTPDVYITFTTYAPEDDPPYTPTDGDLAYLFTDEDDSEVTVPDGTGGVLIGGRPVYVGTESDDIRWVGTSFFDADEMARNTDPMGVWPGGDMRPGIILTPDSQGQHQDIGMIQVGGAVFGDVDISGSIGKFYCGYLGTNRFEVAGDLQSLLVHTMAGGIAESDDSWTPVDDAVLEVGGNLGGIVSQDDWGLGVRVYGRSNAPQFPGVLDVNSGLYVRTHREIETKYDTAVYTDFMSGALNNNGGEYIFENDSPYTAEPLGTIDGKIVVMGEMESDVYDIEDFYSFAVMAGQTFSITLYHTGGTRYESNHPIDPDQIEYIYPFGLDLFDPELNWIGNNGEAVIETGEITTLTFTAETAGIYTVGINGIWGTEEYSGLPYRLEIDGVTETSMGGMNVVTSFRHDTMRADSLIVAGVTVVDGNVGYISVGDIMRDVTINVNNGSLGAVRAAANTMALGDIANRTWNAGPEAPGEVPATGFGMEIDDEGDGIGWGRSVINVSGDLGQVYSVNRSGVDIFVGGDFQSLRIGGDLGTEAVGDDASFTGEIVVNGSIGEIRIFGDFQEENFVDEFGGSWGLGRSGIYANADSAGGNGYIDVLLVGGNFEDLPISVGARGGNVRFVDIRGNIRWNQSNIQSDYESFIFKPGQSVVITDDSGALITVAPGYRGSSNDTFYFNSTTAGSVGTEDDTDGVSAGVLTIKMLPIYDIPYGGGTWNNRTMLGYAIAGIDSTDGLVISAEGGPVEIGYVTVDGVNSRSVTIKGNEPVSILQLDVTAAEITEGQDDDTDTGTDTNGTGTDTDGTDTTVYADDPYYPPNNQDSTTVNGITRIVNSTTGDMVAITIGGNEGGRNVTADSIDDYEYVEWTIRDGILTPFNLVEIHGNLGGTSSVTGQTIVTGLLDSAIAAVADPGGNQYSGLFASQGIKEIKVYGALGDVDVRGDVRTIEVNADNSMAPDQYDGIVGSVIVYGNLGDIYVGDGVQDPGTGYRSQAGVFVYGSINKIEVSGKGHDIAGPVFALSNIEKVEVLDGGRLLGYNGWADGWIESLERPDNMYCKPTIAVTSDFTYWQLEDDTIFTFMDRSIGSVRVTGQDSAIYTGSLWASTIDSIYVGNGAADVQYAYIYAAEHASVGSGTISKIVVSGADILDSVIAANREMKSLKVINGKIQDSEIRSGYLVGSVQADEIDGVDIDAFNRVDSVKIKGEVYDLVIETGSLGKVQAGGDILGSAFFVAGPVELIQTKGDLISTIEVTGPFGDLQKVNVSGDLGTPTGGEIIVDGQIGQMKVGGDFLAELLLNWDPDAEVKKYSRNDTVLNKLKVDGSILGIGHIGGNINSIQSGDDFGLFGSSFVVHGDFNSLKVGPSNDSAALQSSLTVEGELGKVTIYGDVNGKINVFDDFNSLKLIGKGDTADLNASIAVGGDFKTLSISNGQISAIDVVDDGPLTIDVTGSGPKQKIKNANSKSISFSAASVNVGVDNVGDKTFDPVIAIDTDPSLPVDKTDVIAITKENDRDALAGIRAADNNSITVVDGSDLVQYDGSLIGTYASTDNIGQFILGQDLAETGILVIDGDLDRLIVTGNIAGKVHVTGSIGEIVTANVTPTAVITAGGDIGSLTISGTISNSVVLAGFDPGLVSDVSGGVFGANELTVNGTNVDANESALTGSIGSVQIGTFFNSVIAAGVSPGSNAVFGDTDGSDVPGVGQSSIGNVTIDAIQGDGLGGLFGIFADTEIGQLRIDGDKVPTPITLDNGFRAWTVTEPGTGGVGGFIVEAGSPFTASVGGVDFKIVMNGPGVAEIVLGSSSIETIYLAGTNLSTKLKITAAKGQDIDVADLYTDDDHGLGTLDLAGSIIGSLQVDGNMNQLSLAGIGAGAVLTIDGKVSKADLGTVSAASTLSILSQCGFMIADSIDTGATLSASQYDKIQIKGEQGGTLLALDGDIQQITINDDLSGMVSTEGSIDKMVVKGTVSGSVRAAEVLDKIMTGPLYTATIAAGGNFNFLKVKGDVTYSTIASGLDVGANGNAYSGADVISGRGDLSKVMISGDFVQSNIAAGVAPGQDNLFDSADDIIEQRVVQDVHAPQVIDISFPDYYTIGVQFREIAQTRASNIGSIKINGEIKGSTDNNDHFAIIAAGEIDSIIADRQAFGGTSNMAVSMIEDKAILSSSIVSSGIDNLSDALNAAFKVKSPGLDNLFGTSDDIYIYGDDDSQTEPTVWVSFDEDTNTAYFHNEEGFLSKVWGTNYFEVRLDASQVVNRQGVALDGEVEYDQWPTGDGVPGGDFVYYFAVGDLGGSVTTAYSPFADAMWMENVPWTISSILGDNLAYSSDQAMTDADFIRLNDLKKGQVLSVDLINEITGHTGSSLWENTEFQISMVIVSDDLQTLLPMYLIGQDARPDLDPARDIVIPNLDEVAYDGQDYCFYESQQGNFYSYSTVTRQLTLMNNTLRELNSLVITEWGSIENFYALEGHSQDSYWAIADFIQGDGSTESHLLLIDRLSQDINNGDVWQRAGVTVYPNPLGSSNIVGLAERDGVLYGVDGATNALLQIDSLYDTGSATSGAAVEIGSLGNDELMITGLAVDYQGDGLLALHDQMHQDTITSLTLDGIYSIDITTGQATLAKTLDFGSNDEERHGLATNYSGELLIGLPLRDNPLGDEMTITFGSAGTETHTFGTDRTDFGDGNRVDSNAGRVYTNTGQQQFINEGFYWAFDVEYARTPGLGTVIVTISDIDWLNDTEFGGVYSVVSDDADNVDVTQINGSAIQIQIDTEHGDGDVRVFFAGTSMVETSGAPVVNSCNPAIGEDERSDLSPTRDLIMPSIDEMSIASDTLDFSWSIDLTTALDAQLAQVLTGTQMNQLRSGDLTYVLLVDIDSALDTQQNEALYNAFYSAITMYTYEAVVYDAQQELFALQDTDNGVLKSITVINPQNVNQTVPLTLSVLDDIFATFVQANPDIGDLTFNSVQALEFDDDDALWMVVDVTDNTTGQTRQSLLGIDDITNPYQGMDMSSYDLTITHSTQGRIDTNVTDLAFGMTGDIAGRLFGIDAATNSLVVIDSRSVIAQSSDQFVANPDFGKVTLWGGIVGNLGYDGMNLTGMDFDSTGRLIAVDDNSNALVQISTAPNMDPGEIRTQLLGNLSVGDYTALSFDPSADFDSSEDVYAFISQSVTGSPLDIDLDTPGNQGDDLTVRLYGQGFVNHTFGGSLSTVGGVTISSTAADTNGYTNIPADVIAKGGYYHFAIDYSAYVGSGDMALTFNDIDWPDDSSAIIDSVVLSDTIHAQVNSYSTEGFTILIDTTTGAGTLNVYFGATARQVTPYVDDSSVIAEQYSLTSGESPNVAFTIPYDADYVLVIEAVTDNWSSAENPIPYELELTLFNDGNSDFGVPVTDSGYIYDQIVPSNSAVNVELGSDHMDTDPDNQDSYQNDPVYPIEFEGGLVPGQASQVVIDTNLFNRQDVDVYTFRMQEGQTVTVDIDAETLYGRDISYLDVGIYNGDLELIATVGGEADDVVASVAADPYYSAQAIFSLANHPGVVIDPSTNGLGTYYVVVTGDATRDVIDYRLTIGTSETPANVQVEANKPSQLVYLSFEGGEADYLEERYGSRQVSRPAFDATDFGMQDYRTALIAEVADRIEQIYRDAGLTDSEIDFTTTKPALGQVYSTVYFGGRLPDDGVSGLAEQLDRHNADRTDMAIVLTEEMALSYMGFEQLSEIDTERFDQVATLLSNVGAHELGHILGLEHATEVNTDDPNNLMGYNDDLVPQELETRNSPILFGYDFIGFNNEIDMLLRNIGSATPMGS